MIIIVFSFHSPRCAVPTSEIRCWHNTRQNGKCAVLSIFKDYTLYVPFRADVSWGCLTQLSMSTPTSQRKKATHFVCMGIIHSEPFKKNLKFKGCVDNKLCSKFAPRISKFDRKIHFERKTPRQVVRSHHHLVLISH